MWGRSLGGVAGRGTTLSSFSLRVQKSVTSNRGEEEKDKRKWGGQSGRGTQRGMHAIRVGPNASGPFFQAIHHSIVCGKERVPSLLPKQKL